jgi:branched-chain amino acid transport system permease protein
VLPEVLHFVKEYNVLVYGLILMGVVIFFPEGLFPGIREIFRSKKKASSEEVGLRKIEQWNG